MKEHSQPVTHRKMILDHWPYAVYEPVYPIVFETPEQYRSHIGRVTENTRNALYNSRLALKELSEPAREIAELHQALPFEQRWGSHTVEVPVLLLQRLATGLILSKLAMYGDLQ